MAEITFISNKTRKETSKYFFIFVFAVITWILQVAVFSRILYFDAMPNLLLISSIYLGIIFGPICGMFYGITASFLSSNISYDHVFYFSYPLAGLIAGLFTKNLFSDELLFFILLCFLFTFPFEFLNGWQYSLINPIKIMDRYLQIGFFSALLTLFLSLFYYLIMKFITKKLNFR